VVSFPSIYIAPTARLAAVRSTHGLTAVLPKQIQHHDQRQDRVQMVRWYERGNYNAYLRRLVRTSPSPLRAATTTAFRSLMVWLSSQGLRQPISATLGTLAPRARRSHLDRVERPRNTTATGTRWDRQAGISYVANDSPVKDLNFDLKDFINDAVRTATPT